MINKLREKLLNTIDSCGENLITETVSAIQSTLGCDMCELWSINRNNTDSELGEFISASLIVRCLNVGSTYPTNWRKDYAHPLNNSFIEYVLDFTFKNDKTYYLCDSNDDNYKRHLSYDSLKKMELAYFICIPIKDVGKEDAHAFIKLAYKDKLSKLFIDSVEEMASVINKAIVSAFSRYQIYKKQHILDELINVFSQNKTSLYNIFYFIINKLFKSFFYYEGASVFFWNSFDNRYNLFATTGLESTKNECYYKIGEGLTGKVASEKKAKIYDNLDTLDFMHDSNSLCKYRENTPHRGRTLLVVPILSPSNPDKVLGIIRFTNKINKFSKMCKKDVLDYFNDADVGLIKYVSHYLALIIDNYLAEEERKDFITKMSHELKTPANAIRVTAERTLRKVNENDISFFRNHFEHYMQSIIEYSDLLIMQVTTNLYITKSKISYHSTKYNVGKYSIITIIKESINIIRPIARDRGAAFANIEIESDFPDITLNVNKDDFIIIFYNLLTNAIKYRIPKEEFHVLIRAKYSQNGLFIYIEDIGIGVTKGEEDLIFNLGARGKNARRMNAEGYGMGLHVVRLIIESYGGEVKLSHNQDPTVFEIKLPCKLIIKNLD